MRLHLLGIRLLSTGCKTQSAQSLIPRRVIGFFALFVLFLTKLNTYFALARRCVWSYVKVASTQRMPTFARFFIRVFVSRSAFSRGISHIVSLTAKKQMRRIATKWRITLVQDISAFGYFSIDHTICKAVRPFVSWVGSTATDVQMPVALAIYSPGVVNTSVGLRL